MTDETNEAAVAPQEQAADVIMDQIMDNHESNSDDNNAQTEERSQPEKTMVPLHELQKLREKKKELELELQWEKQERARMLNASHAPAQAEPDDNSRYESATKEDLTRSQQEILRAVEEKRWEKDNPEKFSRVKEFLPQFLKQRPNLIRAIEDAPNRYEEAYELMDKLSPKQEQAIRKAASPAPRKDAPNAPGGVPKAAQLNEAVDLMNMSDKEFADWRQSKKRAR